MTISVTSFSDHALAIPQKYSPQHLCPMYKTFESLHIPILLLIMGDKLGDSINWRTQEKTVNWRNWINVNSTQSIVCCNYRIIECGLPKHFCTLIVVPGFEDNGQKFSWLKGFVPQKRNRCLINNYLTSILCPLVWALNFSLGHCLPNLSLKHSYQVHNCYMCDLSKGVEMTPVCKNIKTKSLVLHICLAAWEYAKHDKLT